MVYQYQQSFLVVYQYQQSFLVVCQYQQNPIDFAESCLDKVGQSRYHLVFQFRYVMDFQHNWVSCSQVQVEQRPNMSVAQYD